MAKRDYYEVLGVGKTASADEIIADNPLIFDRDSMQKMAHYLLGESG